MNSKIVVYTIQNPTQMGDIRANLSSMDKTRKVKLKAESVYLGLLLKIQQASKQMNEYYSEN